MQIIDAFCVVGNSGRDCITPDELLKSMDENDIQKSIIVPRDCWTAVYNAEGNDFIAESYKKHPGRFFRFAVANPWYGQKAVTELSACLKEGFNGVYFKSTVQGFVINDEIVYPLLEQCEQFDVPVYFHTGTPALALPFQVLYLARRFPKVNFILGHMGAYDFVGDAYASAELEQNIYLDTSWGLTLFMRTVADKYSNQAVFGSGSPRSTQYFELNKMRDAVGDKEKLNKIFGENILNILGGSK
jgi:uncharacterized protein